MLGRRAHQFEHFRPIRVARQTGRAARAVAGFEQTGADIDVLARALGAAHIHVVAGHQG